jgi:hypothetical protein
MVRPGCGIAEEDSVEPFSFAEIEETSGGQSLCCESTHLAVHEVYWFQCVR